MSRLHECGFMSRKRDDPAWWAERRRKDIEFRRSRRYDAHWNQRYASLWQYRVDEARQRRRAENRSRWEVQQATLPSSSSARASVPTQGDDVLMRLRTNVKNACTARTSSQCASAGRQHWPSLSKETGLDAVVRICAGCGCPIAPLPAPGVSTQTERELKATQTSEFSSNRGTQTCDV